MVYGYVQKILSSLKTDFHLGTHVISWLGFQYTALQMVFTINFAIYNQAEYVMKDPSLPNICSVLTMFLKTRQDLCSVNIKQ